MHHMGLSLTDEQRRRLEILANREGRNMSNMVARLIDLEFETQTAYRERSAENVGAQNPEPITVTIAK